MNSSFQIVQNSPHYFQTALFLDIPQTDSSFDSSQSSINSNENSISNYLPNDLMTCIDSNPLSPTSNEIDNTSEYEDESQSNSYLNNNSNYNMSLYFTQGINFIPNTHNIYLNTFLPQFKHKLSEDYIVEMFGRRGWICEQCNNFNYESRVKCNRCGIQKMPKKIGRTPSGKVNTTDINIRNINGDKNISENDKKGDWVCLNCGNVNYSFRMVCNRCQLNKNDIKS